MSTKDFLEKDYYKVIGVSKTANADEIKKSYRKLARKYHPDANKGDSKAEERFKEISEAYNVLSDPKQRKEYDEARSLFGGGFRRPGQAGAGGQGGFGGFDLGDLFGGGTGTGPAVPGRRWRRPGRHPGRRVRPRWHAYHAGQATAGRRRGDRDHDVVQRLAGRLHGEPAAGR